MFNISYQLTNSGNSHDGVVWVEHNLALRSLLNSFVSMYPILTVVVGSSVTMGARRWVSARICVPGSIGGCDSSGLPGRGAGSMGRGSRG